MRRRPNAIFHTTDQRTKKHVVPSDNDAPKRLMNNEQRQLLTCREKPYECDQSMTARPPTDAQFAGNPLRSFVRSQANAVAFNPSRNAMLSS